VIGQTPARSGREQQTSVVRGDTASSVRGHAPPNAQVGVMQLQRIVGNRAVSELLHTAVLREQPAEPAASLGLQEELDRAGQPLDPAIRGWMETRLGYDFGDVRVHTDVTANQSAASISAEAYTFGSHVVFGAGRYAPQTTIGRRLLGHELAHVVQQSRGGSLLTSPSLDKSLEQAADQTAAELTGATGRVAVAGASSPNLARQPSSPNSIEDLLTFLHAQAGFATGRRLPPTFNPRSASPFGTAAHKEATRVLSEMKGLMPGAERIISEPVIVNGVITRSGGGPGGAPKGAHVPDILVTKENVGTGIGEEVSEIGEAIGDLKYGGGTIAPKYGAHGLPLRTLTGRTQPAPAAASAASTSGASSDLGVGGDVTTDVVTGGEVAKDVVTGGEVAKDVVTGGEVAKDVVTGGEVVKDVVTGGEVAKDVVTAAEVAKGTGFLGKASQAVKTLSPALKVLRPLAPVARVVGKVAGPLALGVSAAELATAKTTDEKIDAGISTVSSALMLSKHPVALAAGGGLMAGQALEKSLNVSEYSSKHGIEVYEGLKKIGVNDTAALVAGGVATVLATPHALVEASADKAASWAKRGWQWLKK
jgi:hypothetical protein